MVPGGGEEGKLSLVPGGEGGGGGGRGGGGGVDCGTRYSSLILSEGVINREDTV